MAIDLTNYEETAEIVIKQLSNFWPTEKYEGFVDDVRESIEDAKRGFEQSTRKYYLNNGFSVLNSSIYSTFLYYLSHRIGIRGEVQFADKLYYLNKIMNSVEWYWNIELPKHFIVEHPIESVLGRATYGDYFSIYQGATVGERLKKDETSWPVLGEYVTMFANSSIIGRCHIGNWCIISANTHIINQDIPDNSIVFGNSPSLVIKTLNKEEIMQHFIKSWKL